MTSHIKITYFLVFLITVLSSWFYLSYHVAQNTADFHPDEMYWIGTARIVPLLTSHNTTDPFWREYYGYANFNGAKLLYGVSLWGLGYESKDFAFTGYQPDTYYQFASIHGRYPQNNPHYPLLQDARKIHALFASLSIGVFALVALVLFGDVLTAFFSGFILIVHPVFQSVSTIAFADMFSLFFELLFLFLLELYIIALRKTQRFLLILLLGATIAFLTAVQIQGLFFMPFLLLYALAKHKPFHTNSLRDAGEFVFDITFFSISALIVFFALHPNFLYSGAKGPFEIAFSKWLIIQYQMSYYSQIASPHVLVSIPARILASFNYLFQGSLIGLLSVLSGIVLIMRNFRVPYIKELSRLSVCALYLFVLTIATLVFDESRLLLPLLPFVILFSVYIFAAAAKAKSS